MAALAGAAIWLSPLRSWIDPHGATAWLRSIGNTWWAPFVMLGLYVLFSLTFVPVLPLAAAAALIWGWVWGGVIEIVIATIAALPPYLLARSTASGWIESRMRQRFGVNYDLVRIRATSGFFMLRLIPILPFSVLNYLGGLAAIRPIPYTVSTFVGMIPSIFIFTYLVEAVASGTLTTRQATIRVLLGGTAAAVLFLVARIVAHRVQHRGHGHR